MGGDQPFFRHARCIELACFHSSTTSHLLSGLIGKGATRKGAKEVDTGANYKTGLRPHLTSSSHASICVMFRRRYRGNTWTKTEPLFFFFFGEITCLLLSCHCAFDANMDISYPCTRIWLFDNRGGMKEMSPSQCESTCTIYVSDVVRCHTSASHVCFKQYTVFRPM